ncbi:TIGR00730 family Rossman fold protein [Acinetobacter sp. A3.8]|uniref:Cytokinin riboside 5'-monophosphate phosphoribohydrolase n=1 Tax=Acinetobacter sedimenti TaxID=2919922 RepID=A0A9X1WX44_9GAMM|nr:TIGR00730 family Rossman fold protein [Acinetobacter sedimenti]MCJ8145457.1 TIGR00730 family Rossman fold protein [Acinetobacter sedimenti]
MQAIAIFCGSSSGNDTHYIESAQLVGEYLAKHQLTLIYGGGKVGLMGAVADSALASGGKVIGVMPKDLVDREIAHQGLSELHVVANMHERKQKMAKLADGFIALPGGAGTLEEIAEQWTWAQLGIHQKPCAFLNVLGYYDPLITMVNQMANKHFTKQMYADMLIHSDSIETIISEFQNYQAPHAKWIKGAVEP